MTEEEDVISRASTRLDAQGFGGLLWPPWEEQTYGTSRQLALATTVKAAAWQGFACDLAGYRDPISGGI